MRTAGIVLCGGRSSRMGRAKAWLPWNGRPMISHVIETLRCAVDEVVVVSSGELELPDLKARVVRDELPGLGPLAGIREGLAAVSGDLAYVTGTDAPFLTAEFVRAMFAFGGAAAPEVDGSVQTLAAVYPRSALPLADRLLAERRLRPLWLLEAAGYRKVLPDELPSLAPLRGFNTPHEYLDAVCEAFGPSTAMLEFVGRSRLRVPRPALPVPVGTLAQVLGHAAPELDLCRDGRVVGSFLVSLNGRDFVRDGGIPIGPGERAIVMDASVGG